MVSMYAHTLIGMSKQGSRNIARDRRDNPLRKGFLFEHWRVSPGFFREDWRGIFTIIYNTFARESMWTSIRIFARFARGRCSDMTVPRVANKIINTMQKIKSLCSTLSKSRGECKIVKYLNACKYVTILAVGTSNLKDLMRCWACLRKKKYSRLVWSIFSLSITVSS